MSSTTSDSKGLIASFFEWFGNLGLFFWQVARAGATRPFEFGELFRQLDEIGSKSLPLVALAGAATGVVLSLEARYSLTRFGAKALLPAPSSSPSSTKPAPSSPASSSADASARASAQNSLP